MENKKMTAVERLYEKMYIHKGLITIEEYNQALKMEKEQLAEKDKEIEGLKKIILSAIGHLEIEHAFDALQELRNH